MSSFCSEHIFYEEGCPLCNPRGSITISSSTNYIKEYNIQPDNIKTWISVNDELPNEGGRYWCYVKELNDLGISHFQWNCSFTPGEGFSDLCQRMNVTHWTYLLESPKQ